MLDNKIFDKFTLHARHSLTESLNIAQFCDAPAIYPEHLLYAILLERGSLGSNILKDLGLNKDIFDKIFLPKKKKTEKEKIELTISSELKEIITRSYLLASKFNYPYIGTEHLVFSIIETPSEIIQRILILSQGDNPKIGADNEKITQNLLASTIDSNRVLNKGSLADLFKSLNLPALDFPLFPNKNKNASTTPNLDYFCTNLNKKVEDKSIVLIGREMELEKIFNSLGRKNKNNPLLIGDSGVGKTALVEGLAKRINSEQVPEHLLNKKILSLDIALVVAGTNFRGEFEQRLKDILEEVSSHKDIILFIDEIHGIVGAGNASGGLDAANILKPLLTQGNIRCIGASTIEEYKKYIEKDPALERRFQPVVIKESSSKDTLKIIQGIKKNYEKFHNVIISKEAASASVDLSSRYIQDRFQPDKSIDLIDETSSRIKSKINSSSALKEISQLEKKLSQLINKKHTFVENEKYDQAINLRKNEDELINKISTLKNKRQKSLKENQVTISAEDIAQTVSINTSIPLDKILARSSSNLKQLEKRLNNIVIGQDEATKKISAAILRSQSGIGDTDKPIGSFLFLGPSGVGKTLTAKTLAQEFFGDSSALIKIDMSEFVERHNISRLIGAPAGYIGYGEGGKLTEKIRRQPYSIVLFDEIEKAHPDVFNILLQILEDGTLTDAEGRIVNFKNTIVILTSNIGTREFTRASGIGFSSPNSKKVNLDKKFDIIRQKVLEELKNKMKPEILNRLDNIIVFDALDKEDIGRIVILELKKLTNRLALKKIKLNYSKNLVNFIVKDSLSPEKGARFIKKNIRDFIEDDIANKIFSWTNLPKIIYLDIKNGKVTVSEKK